LQRLRNFPVRGAQASIMGRSSHARGVRPFVANRNICHFLWYGGVAGEGLRSVGADGELPIQERVLYPAPRSPFIGPGLSGSGLYNVCIVGRVVLPSLATTWPSLCALGALRWVVCGATMTSPGGVGTTLCCKTPPVLAPPASIMGRSYQSTWLRPLRFAPVPGRRVFLTYRSAWCT
jgi:hypothetical protein